MIKVFEKKIFEIPLIVLSHRIFLYGPNSYALRARHYRIYYIFGAIACYNVHVSLIWVSCFRIVLIYFYPRQWSALCSVYVKYEINSFSRTGIKNETKICRNTLIYFLIGVHFRHITLPLASPSERWWVPRLVFVMGRGVEWYLILKVFQPWA